MRSTAHSHTESALRLLLRASLVLLGVGACGGEADEGGRLDLLTRDPDAMTDARFEPGTDSRVLCLGNGGTVTYRLELGGPATLELRGRTDAAGEIELAPSRVDARNESIVERHRGRVVVQETAGEFGADLFLPDPGDEITQVDVTWTSTEPNGGELVLFGMCLRESNPLDRVPIVFISVDTLSARHLSFHGYGRDTAPNLARFAGEAIVFERCRSNAPWTVPSYLSQFTGLTPEVFVRETSSEERAVGSGFFLPEARWTLAEMMRAAGYRTAAFIDNPHLVSEIGVTQGFDLWDTQAADILSGDPEGGLAHIVPRALAWLDGLAEGEACFLLIQPLDVHGPYVPAEPFRGVFGNDGRDDGEHAAPVATEKATFLGAIPRYHIDRGIVPGTPGERMKTAPLIAAYDEGIRSLDAILGNLFDALDARGLFDRAVIVVSADHGESMIGHTSFFAHQTLYEDVVHVPLLVRLPEGRGGGRRIDASVQLVDLYPTFSELAGRTFTRPWLRGTSLVPWLEGGSASSVPVTIRGGLFEGFSIVRGDWKLIEIHPRPGSGRLSVLSLPQARTFLAKRFPELENHDYTSEELWSFMRDREDLGVLWGDMLEGIFCVHHELYHLPSDPGEKLDLAASEPERLAELLELLERERVCSERAREEFAFEARYHEPTPEMIEALERLGYAGDG